MVIIKNITTLIFIETGIENKYNKTHHVIDRNEYNTNNKIRRVLINICKGKSNNRDIIVNPIANKQNSAYNNDDK